MTVVCPKWINSKINETYCLLNNGILHSKFAQQPAKRFLATNREFFFENFQNPMRRRFHSVQFGVWLIFFELINVELSYKGKKNLW